MNISIIGNDYYGLFNGILYAYYNRNYNINIIDINKIDNNKVDNKCNFFYHDDTFQHKIKDINIIKVYLDILTNIVFTHNISTIQYSDIIFITKTFLTNNETNNNIIDIINKYAKNKAIIIIKNSDEIGFTDKIIENNILRKDLELYNIPDYIIKYTPLDIFIKQTDKIIIGKTKQTTQEGLNKLKSLFITLNIIKNIIVTESKTAELSKLYNSLLIAQQLSTFNIIKNISHDYDINYKDIIEINNIKQLSPNYELGNIGYTDDTLSKDIDILSKQCKDNTFSKYIKDTDCINNLNIIKLCDKIERKKYNSTILVLGYNYKNNMCANNDRNNNRLFDKLYDLLEDEAINEYDIDYDRIMPSTNKYYDFILIMKHDKAYDYLINEILNKENVKNKNIIDLTNF